MRRKRDRGFSGPPKNPPEPGPLATHDHDWEIEQESNPVLEDGVAIFSMVCRWAETKSVDMGKYGSEEIVVGNECHETKRWQMDLAWFEKKRDGKPNIFYLGSELDNINVLLMEDALIEIESEWEIDAIDPDPDLGHVTVETENYRAKYKADPEPQIDPGVR